jgi:hypothetical protein
LTRSRRSWVRFRINSLLRLRFAVLSCSSVIGGSSLCGVPEMDAYRCEGLPGRGDEGIGVIVRPEGAGLQGNPTLLVAGRRGEPAPILLRRNARILGMRARIALSSSSGDMSWGNVDMPEVTSCHRLLRPRQRGSSLSPLS